MSQTAVKPSAARKVGLTGLLRSFGADPTSPELREVERRVEMATVMAFQGGDEVAELEVHRLLYEINAHRILPPWSKHWRDYEDPVLLATHRKAGEAWLAQERSRFAAGLQVPTAAEDFGRWAARVCQEHASGVTHPLFDFLAERATFEQLRDFIGQETAFDIHFGDLLALLLPGLHGDLKIELAGNFWDEMGRGEVKATHCQLRLLMMDRVGVSQDAYLTEVDNFWLEELRLANLYFQACGDRRLAPQAIGMLLATELVAPGRLDRQIDGWRRVGLLDKDMQYLLEHVVSDVEHAQGWLDNVVVPLAEDRPDLLVEVAIGVLRRLDAALGVCERALREFQPAV